MITVETIHGKFTGYDDDWITKGLQECGAFNRPELSMILSFLRAGDTVLDVGSHIGTYCVPMKKIVGEEGIVYAFEANPETFALLRKNLKDNDVEVRAFNNGVSCKPGILYMQERKNKYISSGSDYLVESPPEGLDQAVEVKLVAIDDVVKEKVDFIKIDVEGMEISVLKSAANTIDRSRPIIYCEYYEYFFKRAKDDPADFERFFKNRNYDYFMNVGKRFVANDEFQLVRIPGPKFVRAHTDFLLIPRESERYPKQFLDWKTYKPYKFIWDRVKTFLSPIKNTLRKVLKKS